MTKMSFDTQFSQLFAAPSERPPSVPSAAVVRPAHVQLDSLPSTRAALLAEPSRLASELDGLNTQIQALILDNVPALISNVRCEADVRQEVRAQVNCASWCGHHCAYATLSI